MITDRQLNRALDVCAEVTRAWPGQGHAWAVNRVLSALADVPEDEHHRLLINMVLGACRQHLVSVQTAAEMSGFDPAQILDRAGHAVHGQNPRLTAEPKPGETP